MYYAYSLTRCKLWSKLYIANPELFGSHNAKKLVGGGRLERTIEQ